MLFAFLPLDAFRFVAAFSTAFFSLVTGGCFVRLALTSARKAQLIKLSIGDLLFLPWEGIFTQQRHELRRHLTPPKLRCVDQVILLLSYACALKHTARLLLASRQLVQRIRGVLVLPS